MSADTEAARTAQAVDEIEIDSGGSVGRSVQTVERALSILKCFSNQQPELTAAEIGSRLRLSRPTTYRLLSTMQRLGFIQREEGTQRYCPGLELVTLSNIALNRMNLRRQAIPELHKALSRLRLGGGLGILQQSDVFILEQRPHPAFVSTYSQVGWRSPAYAMAMGKVLLAGLPRLTAEALLRRVSLQSFTQYTKTRVAEIMQDLDLARERGYGLNDQELNLHWRSVAAPIRDHTGRVVAAFSLTAPESEMLPDKIAEYARQVIDTADRASRKLGYLTAHL